MAAPARMYAYAYAGGSDELGDGVYGDEIDWGEGVLEEELTTGPTEVMRRPEVDRRRGNRRRRPAMYANNSSLMASVQALPA